MAIDPEASSAELENRCRELEKEIATQESWIATLELCINWQNTAITRVRDHFRSTSHSLLQYKDLPATSSSLSQYQFMTCNILSSINETVNTAMLTEAQILSSRFPDLELPYPTTLNDTRYCLTYAVDSCVQRALALEEKAHALEAERDAAAAENAALSERLQNLQVDSEDDPEYSRARRVPVMRAIARPTTIRNTQ